MRTHYPETLADEIRIMEQEARPPAGDVPLRVPALPEGDPRRAHRRAPALAARQPPQRRERPVLDREPRDARGRRGPPGGADRRSPRPSRACATSPPSSRPSLGRIEFDTIEEGREEEILSRALKTAELEVFRRRLSGFDFQPILTRFEQGFAAETSDLTAGRLELLAQFGELPGPVAGCCERLGVEEESPGVAASALEFALEGLHLSRRLNKDGTGRGGAYRYRASG